MVGRVRIDDWPEWVARAQPLALTPVLRVDTGRPVDHAKLARAREPISGQPPQRNRFSTSRVRGPTVIRKCRDPRGWTTCVIPPPWERQLTGRYRIQPMTGCCPPVTRLSQRSTDQGDSFRPEALPQMPPVRVASGDDGREAVGKPSANSLKSVVVIVCPNR